MKTFKLPLRTSALAGFGLALCALCLSPSAAVRAQTPQATPPPPAPPRSVQFPKPVEKTPAQWARGLSLSIGLARRWLQRNW